MASSPVNDGVVKVPHVASLSFTLSSKWRSNSWREALHAPCECREVRFVWQRAGVGRTKSNEPRTGRASSLNRPAFIFVFFDQVTRELGALSEVTILSSSSRGCGVQDTEPERRKPTLARYQRVDVDTASKILPRCFWPSWPKRPQTECTRNPAIRTVRDSLAVAPERRAPISSLVMSVFVECFRDSYVCTALELLTGNVSTTIRKESARVDSPTSETCP